MGGGYYILTNIRKDPKTKECMDIYFITNRIEEKDLLHKITHIDEECRNYMMLNWDEQKKSSTTYRKYWTYNYVKDAVNGFARIINYIDHQIKIDGDNEITVSDFT